MQEPTWKLILAVAGLSVSVSSIAADATFTGSNAGDFAMGQELVTCAAFFDFAAELSGTLGKPASVEHFQNLSRGWNLAGMFLLASGRATDAALTAESIRSVRLSAIKAKYEIQGDPALNGIIEEHKRDCDPLTEKQEAIIGAMRRMPGPGK